MSKESNNSSNPLTALLGLITISPKGKQKDEYQTFWVGSSMKLGHHTHFLFGGRDEVRGEGWRGRFSPSLGVHSKVNLMTIDFRNAGLKITQSHNPDHDTMKRTKNKQKQNNRIYIHAYKTGVFPQTHSHSTLEVSTRLRWLHRNLNFELYTQQAHIISRWCDRESPATESSPVPVTPHETNSNSRRRIVSAFRDDAVRE